MLLGIIAYVAIMYLTGYFANPDLYEMNDNKGEVIDTYDKSCFVCIALAIAMNNELL